MTFSPPSDAAPVLVTGAHRSGTTWMGRLIATHPTFGYVHEPFNARVPGVFPGVPEHYVHIGEHNADEWHSRIADVARARYPLLRHLASMPTRREARNAIAQWSSMRAVRGSRLLVKDPLALFAAEHLHRRYGFDVVATIRSPEGFVSSVMRLNWRVPSPARHLLAQPQLQDFLRPFAAELQRIADRSISHIDEAILLWRLFNSWLADAAERNPQWILVRYEDAAAAPREHLTAVLCRLGLDASSISDETFQSLTCGQGGDRFIYNDVERDSMSAAQTWRQRLEADQVARIEERTADVVERLRRVRFVEPSVSAPLVLGTARG